MPPHSNEHNMFDGKTAPSEIIPDCSHSDDDLQCVQLNDSIETASTVSTETDSSFSKETDTDTSIDEESLNASSAFRQRLFQSPYTPHHNNSTVQLNLSSYNNKRIWRRRGRRELVTISFLLSLAAIALSLSNNIPVPRDLPNHPSQRETWKRLVTDDAPRILRKITTKSPGNEFTIRLKGSRLDLIRQSIENHSQCSSVKEIQIDWVPGKDVPETILNNRKAVPIDKLSTNGLLLLSEDVVLTCDEIGRAFRTWQVDPIRAVGFFPFARHQVGSKDNGFEIAEVPRGAGSYSLLSDRALFVHRMYFNSLSSFREDSYCGRVLLSMQISLLGKKAPITVLSHPQEALDSSKYISFQRTETDQPESKCIVDWADANSLDDLPHENAAYLGST